MEPLISVIIPIYNVENYLEICLNSVINQSYQNLEIILIDDGSLDMCGTICDNYADRDRRIKVIHKENGGLSSARNVGIELCKGKYISFIDSDDFVSSGFIKTLYKGVEKYDSDIVTCTKGVSFLDGSILPDLESGEESVPKIISSYDAIEKILYQRLPNGAQFRLYKREIFDLIRFPEGILFEDVATIHKAFMKAQTVSMVDAKIYGYRIRENSIVRQKFSHKKKIAIPITRNLYEEICSYNAKLKKAAAARAFAQNFHVFLQVPYADYDTRKEFWNEIKKYRWKVMFDTCRMVRLKNRLGALATLCGMNIAYKIGQIFIDRRG